MSVEESLLYMFDLEHARYEQIFLLQNKNLIFKKKWYWFKNSSISFQCGKHSRDFEPQIGRIKQLGLWRISSKQKNKKIATVAEEILYFITNLFT